MKSCIFRHFSTNMVIFEGLYDLSQDRPYPSFSCKQMLEQLGNEISKMRESMRIEKLGPPEALGFWREMHAFRSRKVLTEKRNKKYDENR